MVEEPSALLQEMASNAGSDVLEERFAALFVFFHEGYLERIRHRNMNLLTVVLRMVVIAASVKHSSATCKQEVTCPCGQTGLNITFCSKHLPESEDICQQWANCKSCHPDLDHCTECPDGYKGPTCSQETNNELLVRLKRDFKFTRSGAISRKRVALSYAGSENCPSLKNTGLIALRCTDDGSVRTCRGKCITGYVFKGREGEREIEMTCEQGRWIPTQTFPVCVSSGLCELSLTGEGSGSYNCTMEMNGKKCDVVCDGKRQGRYFCYPGRQWEPRLPHCVQDKEDAIVPHADRRQCQCQNGGTCDAYGRCVCPAGWSGTQCEKSNRHCKLVLTGHSNGSYDCTTEMNGTVCEVQCNGRNRGYFYCYPDRDWQPRLPDCVKVKDDAASIDANRIRCQCRNGGYCYVDGLCVCPAGTSGTNCEKGDAAIREDNLTRCQCQNGGICDNDERCICPEGWSGTYCERLACTEPGTIVNGNSVNMFGESASARVNYKPGEMLYFSCNPGFGLQGSTYITCQTTGSWTKKPTCVQLTRAATTTTPTPVSCPDPGIVQHADRTNINCPSGPIPVYYPGYAVIYTCYSGYVLEGNTFLTCLSSGRWSGQKPVCHVFTPPSTTTARTTSRVDSDPGNLDCLDPGAVANGVRKSYPPLTEQQQGYQRGSRVTYSCKEGYQLQGDESIFCMVGGEWSSSKPRCDPIPRSEDETSIDAYGAPCQCQNGGHCESPGSCVCPSGWSGTNCENADLDIGGLYCLDPGVVENSERESFPPLSARQRGYLQGTRMTYACKEGYQLQGVRSIFCLVGGEWSSTKPTCEPIPSAVQDRGGLYCLDPGAIAHAERTSIPPLSARQRGFLQGSRVTYTCKEGYQLQGEQSMFCMVNGEWSSPKPTCEPIHTVQETYIPAS